MNDGSCNHMTCAVCGCEFCWLCMKEISDLHYLRSVRGPRRSGSPKFCWVKLPVGTHVDTRSATSVCLSFLRVWLHLRKSQRHRKNLLGGLCNSGGQQCHIYSAGPIVGCSFISESWRRTIVWWKMRPPADALDWGDLEAQLVLKFHCWTAESLIEI